jgi:hypothetical protein
MLITVVSRFYLSLLSISVFVASCQVQSYAPPPQQAQVESVEVEVNDFHGRPEAYATVKGTLTTSAAQLVDSKQSRDGDRLYLEVLEQTPRGANLLPDLAASPSFQTRVPIDLFGLDPGSYILSANGIETPIEVPAPRAETFSGEFPVSQEVPAVRIVDEFIPLEDSEFADPALQQPVES